MHNAGIIVNALVCPFFCQIFRQIGLLELPVGELRRAIVSVWSHKVAHTVTFFLFHLLTIHLDYCLACS